ncbi:putative HNH endonuclease [Stenotrophomonas phage Mendera]|uniref:Putative HNH endonuclease n=1 Tax=Stenotrophomonas phage Mendera TaxID=2650877 RepID=A0A5P8PIX1_9CAUD|nr:HNH endonuclease [Stenotrophomonas phage Mendera]QFR56677.1 putative HNH endonuclease [Stenotrophomonas phage Mendera]
MNKQEMNEYMKARWKTRRAELVRYMGGKCAHCGCTDNLEFDHVDPSTKHKTIASMASYSDEKVFAELQKCQLLCTECHKAKSLIDGSKVAKAIDIWCCGKHFTTSRSLAGHKHWCNAPVAQPDRAPAF